jgi:hypothetical protein
MNGETPPRTAVTVGGFASATPGGPLEAVGAPPALGEG